jgi:hypothetical protein
VTGAGRDSSSSPSDGCADKEEAAVDSAVSAAGFDSRSEVAWLKLFKWITDRVLEGFRERTTNGSCFQHRHSAAANQVTTNGTTHDADAPAATVAASDATAATAAVTSAGKENGTCHAVLGE